MDTFFEQIVAIRKTGKSIAAVSGIWLLAVLLALIVLLVGLNFLMLPIAFLLVVGIGYGAFKLSGFFNIEYEYIVTNGTMDVDKIIAKSSRKRMLSFELQTVSRIEKFNPALLNTDDEGAYLMVSDTEGKGSRYLVFAPDERLRGAIVKFVPKFIANSAFK